MSRCQHCKKLTHSEDLYIKYNKNDCDKVFELSSLEKWTPAFQYMPEDPREYGKLKCGDIWIHFICEISNE